MRDEIFSIASMSVTTDANLLLTTGYSCGRVAQNKTNPNNLKSMSITHMQLPTVSLP